MKVAGAKFVLGCFDGKGSGHIRAILYGKDGVNGLYDEFSGG